MLCCSERCEKKNQCALYYRNPQPEYRKYETVEPLAEFGSGSISSEGCNITYDCGPWGDYKLFSPLPDQFLYEKIAAEFNTIINGYSITAENVKAMVDQFKEKL